MRKMFYILLVVVCYACGDDNRCLKSLGDIASLEKQSEKPFSKLYVEDRIKVTIIQDSMQAGKLVLRGPENLLTSIGLSVSEDELRLTNNNTCNFLRSFEYSVAVDVYVNNLTRIGVESIAEVNCKDTLFVDKLEVFHNALSDIELLLNGREVYVQSRNSASTTLTGRIDVLKGSIEEVSDLDASNLLSGEVLLDNHSALDCKINAVKGYYLNLYNTGNIEQYGMATEYAIVNERLGSGNVVQK